MAPTTTIRPRTARRVDVAVDEVGERRRCRYRSRAARGSRSSAPRRRRRSPAARAPRSRAGGHDGKRRQAVDVGRETRSAPSRVPRRLLAPARAPRRCRLSSPPSTLVWPCSSVSAVARTTLRARRASGDSALSSRGVGLLGELDVVDDRRARRSRRRRSNRLRVVAARERPCCIARLEGSVIDRDDDDVARAIGGPQAEAHVDRGLLGAVEDVHGEAGDARRRGDAERACQRNARRRAEPGDARESHARLSGSGAVAAWRAAPSRGPSGGRGRRRIPRRRR